MSYYCTGDGDFKTNNLTKLIENFNKTYNTTGNEIPERAILNETRINIVDVYKDEKNPENAEIYVEFDGNHYEEEISRFMQNFKDIGKGSMRFKGEDGTIWKKVYKNNIEKEYYGMIVFPGDENSRQETLAAMSHEIRNPQSIKKIQFMEFIEKNYDIGSRYYSVDIILNLLEFLKDIREEKIELITMDKDELIKKALTSVFDDVPENIINQVMDMNTEKLDITSCHHCDKKGCPHREAFRRLPKSRKGLGLCPNLEYFPKEN